MDIAYDHIQEEILTPEAAAKQGEKEEGSGSSSKPANNLNTEFQEAYKSFSASPWGAKLGGFFSDVKKQSTTFYDEARSEAGVMGGEAVKGFVDLRESLVSRARSMSTGQNPLEGEKGDGGKEGEGKEKERSQSEALQESEGVISRFRSEAAKRLKDLEKAEEAADAAIFRFGANIGNFLKEAVTVAPPSDEKNGDGSSKVLFESRDQDGKRVIHGTRFEAQLHAIHTSFDKFTKDPESDEYAKWKEGFDVEEKTDAIAKDLENYEELRKTMEKLVPEKVEYKDFWCRYYFLRMIVEADEQRRKEILKGASQSTEDISWDDDDSEDEQASTPQQQPPKIPKETGSPASLTTIKDSEVPANELNLKPAESRKSQDEKSQPDSDASYDLVSGATSRAPGSPTKDSKRADEEEEEDWE
ncbi:MAG: hypothetical protein Q9164_001111 [Protoblastenia rupestris]